MGHPAKFDDGWLRTGDVGRATPDGYLMLVDVAGDNVVRSGGEWIWLAELENHLADHPAMLEVVVIGVADERWGERPLACVVPRDGQQIVLDELRDFLGSRVNRWQVPERWAVLPEIPRTSVGLFDKHRLRQQYADGDLDVHYCDAADPDTRSTDAGTQPG